MIQNFGGGELLVILILALVVLGPERIPEMAKSAGKMIAKLKTMSKKQLRAVRKTRMGEDGVVRLVGAYE